MTSTLAEPVTRAGRFSGPVLLGGLAIWYGVLEIRRTYTLTGYAISWLLRVGGQVLFFGLLGRFVGGAGGAQFLVIGTAVGLILLETLLVVFGAVLDRNLGTLAMLAATPSSAADVFTTRGLQFAVTSVGSATFALLVMPAVLSVDLPWTQTLAVVPALACIALACSGFSGVLSAIVLRYPAATWLVINVGYLFVVTFTGVAVPVDFWPAWMGDLGIVLPVRHGLTAVRDLYAGASFGSVLDALGAELLVGLGWAVVARLAYRLSVARMRRTGGLDLPS